MAIRKFTSDEMHVMRLLSMAGTTGRPIYGMAWSNLERLMAEGYAYSETSKKFETGTHYFLTDAGRMALAQFKPTEFMPFDFNPTAEERGLFLSTERADYMKAIQMYGDRLGLGSKYAQTILERWELAIRTGA